MGNPFTYCVVSFRLPKLKMDGFTCFSFSPLGAAACGMCVRYPAAKSPTWRATRFASLPKRKRRYQKTLNAHPCMTQHPSIITVFCVLFCAGRVAFVKLAERNIFVKAMHTVVRRLNLLLLGPALVLVRHGHGRTAVSVADKWQAWPTWSLPLVGQCFCHISAVSIRFGT